MVGSMPEFGRSLERGANLAITFSTVEASVEWKARCAATVFACLIGKDGKLASKADIVAAGSPSARGGAISQSAVAATKVSYRIDLAGLPADVDKILFCVVTDGAGVDSGDLGLRIFVSSGDEPITHFDLPDDQHAEAAALVGEFYHRSDAWKFRAVGQGFKGGLEPLAKHLHCAVDDLRKASTPSAPAAPRPAPPPSAVSPPATPARSIPPQAQDRPEPTSVSPPGVDLVDQFSCRGWIISPEGVTPAGGRALRGAAALERELLDLRADPQSRLWPAAFVHQPMSGEALLAPPYYVRTAGRSVGLSGLPHLPMVRSIEPASRRDEIVPEGANVFAAGGRPPRLVTLDSAAGRAWWKAPWSGKWVQIGRCPAAATLPHYAIGLVGSDEGVFYASVDGLTQILPGLQPGFRTEAVGGEPVASPATLGEVVALPFEDGRGLGFWVKRLGGESLAVRAKVDDGWQDHGEFGAPVTNAETAFWVGRKGMLGFEDSTEGPTAVWKSWPVGIEGIPFLRPYRSANGRLLAMCREVTTEGGVPGHALLCSILMAGTREKRELLGPHVSVGPQTFRGRDRHAQPWDDSVETVNVGFDYEGRWLLPLIRLGSDLTVVALVKETARDSGSNRAFVFREGAPMLRDAALAVHADNGPLLMLGHSFRIRSTDDFEIFVDAGRLCIHHPESNTCVSWSISF
jgi:stress response protein SCP2